MQIETSSFCFLEQVASDWPRLNTRPGFSPLIGRDEEELTSDDDFDDEEAGVVVGTGRDTDDL